VVRTAKANFPEAGIDLVQLSRFLQGQGAREKVAYNLILQAVRKGVLVALPSGPTPEPDLASSEED
jgi:predicted TIM-barrel fold metal-dependent hydrolase